MAPPGQKCELVSAGTIEEIICVWEIVFPEEVVKSYFSEKSDTKYLTISIWNRSWVPKYFKFLILLFYGLSCIFFPL